MSDQSMTSPAHTGVLAALREEQHYAYTLSEALIGLGHHAAAKHQPPDQYDSESGLACVAPSCLLALRPPSEDAARLREAVEYAAREFRRLKRENSALQMDEALAGRPQGLAALATPAAPTEDAPEAGRWSRSGWHEPACWRAWAIDPDSAAECSCDALRGDPE